MSILHLIEYRMKFKTSWETRSKDWANEAPYSFCRLGRAEKFEGIEPLSMFPDRMLQSPPKHLVHYWESDTKSKLLKHEKEKGVY